MNAIQTALFDDGPDKAERDRQAREAREARGAGIRKVASREGQESWKQQALATVYRVASQRPELTTDDLWDMLPAPEEPRIMGCILPMAARRGWIERTNTTTPSRRKQCHARPVAVWRSKLYSAA